MSFLHLANTLHHMQTVHMNKLAYRKFGALDAPLTISSDEEATTVRLAELLDRSQNAQVNLTDVYNKLGEVPKFRDLSMISLPEKLSENIAIKVPIAPEPSPAPTEAPKPAIKFRAEIKKKWVPPEYPYHSYYIPSFKKMAAVLLNEKSDRDKSGNPEWNLDRSDDHLAVVRRMFPGNIYSADAITDHVVEPVRISCYERAKTGGNLPSPKEVWEKLLRDAKSGGEQIPTNVEDAHEMVYQISRGCNLFNISLGIYLLTGEKNNNVWGPINALKGSPGDVLDPAAGWGDRLGAAFISGAKSYRGWDTNDKLQPVYGELARQYKELGLTLDWDIQNAPFETADLQGAMFDTVITSPPFFDKEIYEGASTSTSVHRGRDGWIKNYYHPMLMKAGGSLRAGGRFMAYISEGWMVKEAKAILEGVLKMKYVGRVGFVQTVQDKAVEPWQIRNTYIWRVPGGETVAPRTAAATMEYTGAPAYLRLMKAIEGKTKAAGGYNISDLVELVKYHKPDMLPKEVNRDNLLKILKGVREAIRLGPPTAQPETKPEAPAPIIAEPEAPAPIVAEPEEPKETEEGIKLVPVHEDHLTALRKIQEKAENRTTAVDVIRIGTGQAGRIFLPPAPRLEQILNLKKYNTIFNNNEIVGLIGIFEVKAGNEDARYFRNLSTTHNTAPHAYAVSELPLPKESTYILHGFMNTNDTELVARVFKDMLPKNKRLYDVDNGKNMSLMKSLGFINVSITDTSTPAKWYWYEYLPKEPEEPATDSKFKLERLEPHHRAGVEKLTSDAATMKMVGTGRTWDKRKIDDLFRYAKMDKGKMSQYVSYVIITDGDVRGMLQFHPSAANNNLAVDPRRSNDIRLYLTIFIHPDYQRKGLAERSIRQAIDELREERGHTIAFGAHIAATNKPSLALHKKLNFKVEAVDRIGLREFMALSLPPPLPAAAKGTYILDLENLMLPEHRAKLDKSMREITLDKAVEIGGCEHVIMHGAMEEDKRLWDVVTVLRSRLDAEVITNKAWLHDMMKGASPSVLAKSDRLKGVTTVPTFNDEKGNPMTWIWRPEEEGAVGWGGKGIVIGRGQEDLKALLSTNERLTGLLTQYEENPMLLPWKLRDFPHNPSYALWRPGSKTISLEKVEMRKFHLRVYVVIVTDQNGKRMGIFNSGHFICFADKEYNKDDLTDMDIHNTRFRGNNGKPFPEGWPSTATVTAEDLMKQMVQLFRAVAARCMPSVRPYAESHYGYEILGCDVMVNASGKAWIVEMNKKPGTGGTAAGTPGVLERMSRNLYGGILDGYLKTGSSILITEVWREGARYAREKSPSPAPAPKKSLEEKGAAVSVKDKRSNIAVFHSQVKYYFLKTIKSIIRAAMPDKRKLRVLDLACGRGGDLFKYLDTFGKDTFVNGVDIDAGAIAEAKRRVKSKGLSNITLSVADVSNPDLDTSKWGEAYDVIVCNFAAHYFFRSREALDSFTRLLNRYSKEDTIVWMIMPGGIRLIKLLLEKGTRSGSKVSIDNNVYKLSSTFDEMSKAGGKVDYKLHGTTYFQTAEPGANIITEGTSHEYFADLDSLFESLSITAEPPTEYLPEPKGGVINKRFISNNITYFSQYPFIGEGDALTPTEKEISFTNLNVILRCTADPVEKPTRDGQPIPEKELTAYWREKEKGLGKELPYVRTEPGLWWAESDKKTWMDLRGTGAPP